MPIFDVITMPKHIIICFGIVITSKIGILKKSKFPCATLYRRRGHFTTLQNFLKYAVIARSESKFMILDIDGLSNVSIFNLNARKIILD